MALNAKRESAISCSCGRWHRIEWPSKFWRSEFGHDRTFVTCDRCGDTLNADGTVKRAEVVLDKSKQAV